MNKISVIDLHCDLLAYLGEKEGRTDHDPVSRASYPQLREGGVVFQALAVFSKTQKGSVETATKEIDTFRKLSSTHWEKTITSTDFSPASKIRVLLAIENASGLLEEEESIDLLFSRLDRLLKEFSHLLYITLTWHDENRFGGGNKTHVGLKKDGEEVLSYLNGKKIAVDLSHTSDELARDIVNTIDKRGFKIPIIASHSNFRAVQEDQPRNLPDDLAREIIKRGGLIGLNVIADFVGRPFEQKFIRHIEHGLSLGGKNCLAFGADFFYDLDYKNAHPSESHTCFDKDYQDASCYSKLLAHIQKNFQDELLERIAHQNAINYFDRWQIF